MCQINQCLEDQDIIHVHLQNTVSGFGFTIIGGDHPGELLQIKCIVRGSIADHDGRLQVGDELVRINGISLFMYTHRKVVDIVQSLPLNSEVSLEVRRGYPLQDSNRDEPSREYPLVNDVYNPPEPIQMQHNPEVISMNIVKGLLGFGFSVGNGECKYTDLAPFLM